MATLATLATLGLAAAPLRAHADRVVAIMPLSTLGTEDTSASTRKLATQLETAFAALPATKVITADQVGAAITRAKQPQLRVCERDAACLAEVGKLVGAAVVIDGEIGGLGDSQVVYLGATDVATRKELGSTTLSVGAKEDTGGGASGAAVRLLDADRFRGTVALAIDVGGATVYVNGSRVALGKGNALTLPVGTHAVRVTHPEYRDFVRFVDVPYAKQVDVAVGMQQYPILTHDIAGKPINAAQTVYVDPPVWRRWYVVGPAAVGVAILTAIIVGNLVHDFPDGECRRVGGGSC